MRRSFLPVALLIGSGCTSLLGIDGDYELGAAEGGGAPSGSAASGSSTGAGAGAAVTGSTGASVSGSGSSGGEVVSSGAGGGGGAGGGEGGGPPATCDDDVLNGDETDTDCGGSCEPCGFGRDCAAAEDCETQNCVGDVCACPPGRTPNGGGCACVTRNVACGDGPADICIPALVSSNPAKLLDDDEAPGVVRLAANGVDEAVDPYYALYWSKPTSGTALGRYEVDGSPRGEPIDVDSGAEVPLAVYAEGNDEVVLTTDGEGSITLDVVDFDGPLGLDLPILDEPGFQIAVSAAHGPYDLAERAIAYVDDGALAIAMFNRDQVRAEETVAPDGVTAVAVTAVSLNGGFLTYGVAFVRDGALYFARYDTQGNPTVPIASLDPIDLDGVDFDRPIFAAADSGRWFVGGTSTAGATIVGVLDAGASLVESVRVTEGSTELAGLFGGDGYVHVLWTVGVSGRPGFTRLVTTGQDTVVELPFLEIYTPDGALDILDIARMYPPGNQGASEVGVLYRLSQSSFDPLDGLYVARLGLCP